MSYKRYYLPGVDEIHQLVETPASKEKTDRIRFVVTVVVSVAATIFLLLFSGLLLTLVKTVAMPQPTPVSAAVAISAAVRRLCKRNGFDSMSFCIYDCRHMRKSFFYSFLKPFHFFISFPCLTSVSILCLLGHLRGKKNSDYLVIVKVKHRTNLLDF